MDEGQFYCTNDYHRLFPNRSELTEAGVLPDHGDDAAFSMKRASCTAMPVTSRAITAQSADECLSVYLLPTSVVCLVPSVCLSL